MVKRPAKEFQTSLLLDPAVKEKAQIAAAQAGRSTSAELRLRIERTFAEEEAGSSMSAPLVRMIAQAIRAAEERSGLKWYGDPGTATECRRIINGILDLLLPSLALNEDLPSAVDTATNSLLARRAGEYGSSEWNYINDRILILQQLAGIPVVAEESHPRGSDSS